MLPNQCYQTFCQSDETDAQSSLINNTLNGIIGVEFIGAYPQTAHQQWELLDKSCFLELEAFIQLLRCHFQHLIEFGKELSDTCFFIFYIHAFNSQTHNIDSGERKITTTNGGLWTETVFEHTCTTSHSSHLVDIALGVVGTPLTVLIIRGIKIQEIGEETTSRYLTGQLIEVVIRILRQIINASLLLPYLNGENGCLSVTHSLIGGKQNFSHNATSFGRSISTIVDRREHHLITTA